MTATAPPSIRIAGLVRWCTALHQHLAALAARGGDLPAVKAAIDSVVVQVERLCRDDGLVPTDLPTRSRRAWQWLAYLGQRDHLDRHLQALTLLQRAWTTVHAGNPPLEPRLAHTAAVFQIRRSPRVTRLTLAEGFVLADPPLLQAAARLAAGGPGQAADEGLLVAYGKSEPCRAVWAAIETMGGPPAGRTARGRVHDLDRIFDQLNRDYFQGALPRPHLHWDDKLCFPTLGRYNPLTDTVTLGRFLDLPQVPVTVVAFVLYHELLHKAMGHQQKNGRRYHHHREFRRAEQRFAAFHQAKTFIAHHLPRLAAR